MKRGNWLTWLALSAAAMLMACSPGAAEGSSPQPEPEPVEQASPTLANPPVIVISTAQPVAATLPAAALPSATPAAAPALKTSEEFAPLPGDADLQRGTVFLNQVEVLPQAGDAGKFSLRLVGALPSPCHALRIVAQAPEAGKIALEVYSVTNPKMMCVTMLKEFEVVYTLQAQPAGAYQVWVNDQLVGETRP